MRRLVCVFFFINFLIIPQTAMSMENTSSGVVDARHSVFRLFIYDDTYRYSRTGFAVSNGESGTYAATNDHVAEKDLPGDEIKLGLAFILCFVVVILLSFVLAWGIIKSKRRTTLKRLLLTRGYGFSNDQIAGMMEGLFRTVKSYHDRNRAYGSIYPDNIFIHHDGRLYLGRPAKSIKIHEGNKKYVDLETFRRNDFPNIKADVYAFGAIVYLLKTGYEPEECPRRIKYDKIEDKYDNNDMLLYAVKRAMKLDREERPNDLYDFQATLGYYNGSGTVPVETPRKEEKRSIGLSVAFLSVMAFALFGCVFSSSYLYFENHYNAALESVDMQQYILAQEQLDSILIPYKDSDLLADYIRACLMLEEGNFNKAKDMFLLLADYRDSATKLVVCDYEYAMAVFDDKDYESAKEMFERLGDFNDAEMMVRECDDRSAEDLYEQGNYQQAFDIFSELAYENYSDANKRAIGCSYQMAVLDYEKFESSGSLDLAGSLIGVFTDLGDYEDSEAYLIRIQKTLYTKAENKIRQILPYLEMYKDDFETSVPRIAEEIREILTAIPNYNYSSEYADCMRAITDITNAPQIYQTLKKNWNVPIIQEMILSNYFIGCYLEGEWQNGDDYFVLDNNESRIYGQFKEGTPYREENHSGWWNGNPTTNNPITQYGYHGIFEYRVPVHGSWWFYLKDKQLITGNLVSYTIQYIDLNTIIVYCHNGGSTHTLYRK